MRAYGSVRSRAQNSKTNSSPRLAIAAEWRDAVWIVGAYFIGSTGTKRRLYLVCAVAEEFGGGVGVNFRLFPTLIIFKLLFLWKSIFFYFYILFETWSGDIWCRRWCFRSERSAHERKYSSRSYLGRRRWEIVTFRNDTEKKFIM